MNIVKVTGLSKREMNNVVKEVTKDNNYKWFCKIDGDKIILGNDYFSDGEQYEIYSKEEGYVGAELNYCESKILGLLIDPQMSVADYKEWCIEAFRSMVIKCYRHFMYYV